MEFTRYLKLILQKSWIIVLFLAATLGAGYYYSQNQPLFYTARATLILNPSVSNPLVPYLNTNSSYASSLADNYNLIIKSDKFTAKVADKVGFPISQDELKRLVTTRLAPNTLFYYISVTANQPARAQQIANTVANVFLSEGLSQTNTTVNPNDILVTTVEKQRLELKNLQVEIETLNEQINRLQGDVNNPKAAEQIRVLRQQVRDALDLQSRIILAITEVEGKKDTAASHDSASLVDEAKLPVEPDESNLVRNLIFAGLIGVILGIAVIILLDYLDYTIRTSDELTQLTGFSNLGIVPYIKLGQWKEEASFAADGSLGSMTLNPALIDRSKLQPMLVTANDFQSSASEAYRALRTNLLFANVPDNDHDLLDGEPEATNGLLMRTVLVTSTFSNEGKSLTAANLAVAFAQAGNKVVLVDTDLRKPSLHTLFGMPNDIGFSNLVLGTVKDPTTALKRTSIRKLFLVTAGTLPPNPSELLTSKRTQKIVDALRRIADIVIFDSPPASVVTDAQVLAKRVDQVVVLVAWGRTRRDAITRTFSGLRRVNAKIAGTVLNGVKDRAGSGYSYYSYRYTTNNKRDKKQEKKQKSFAKTR